MDLFNGYREDFLEIYKEAKTKLARVQDLDSSPAISDNLALSPVPSPGFKG